MKAWITHDGCLTVEGETESENYALSRWCIEWDNRKSKLGILLPNPKRQGKIAHKIVETGEYVNMVNKEDV